MPPVIALLTDFGHVDPYVGQMKGTILQHAPGAVIVDLCHEILPHNAGQAGFLLQASRHHFPRNAIFVCVVDPEVGFQRNLLLARQAEQLFLAPDNGLLSFLGDLETSWWTIEPGPATPCHTFHGRDILAPAAGNLAMGADPASLGRPMARPGVRRSPIFWAIPEDDTFPCRVLHVDRFGNCLLNLRSADFSMTGHPWRLENGTLVKEARTYADLAPEEYGLLAGSQGVMELALNQDSCARRLGLAPGDALHLISTRPGRP